MSVDRLLGEPRVGYAVCALALVVVAVAVGSFGVGVGANPDPVAFDDTLSAGLAGEQQFALAERDLVVPRAQVFYSQYRYVVGYDGIAHAIEQFDEPGHTQQFGYPVAVYVWDFADTGVALSEAGYLRTDGTPGWTDAETAHFVVGGEARTPAGETAVPFSSRSAARSFADRAGGRVVDWATLQDHSFDVDDAGAVRSRVDEQRRAADEHVATLRPLADRDVSVTVGRDVPTIQAAIDAAPPGTAVRIPPGTYDETLVVDSPVTLRGENATIRGDGTGSVVEVRSDGVAVVGVSITGVGNQTDAGDGPTGGTDGDAWDEQIASAYGYGDAGIAVIEANRTYVADVTVETPANGILLRDVGRAVVERVTVDGTERWTDGFMGVLSMRSPVVVQDSTVDGGRDGVYLHHAPGSVIRNNTFRDNRFGVHFMYTSASLIADNVARGQATAGITIMTDPSRNAVVGNDVRNAKAGIIPGGSRSYIAENVVANNERGLVTSASSSLYEHNVIYGNDVGVRTGTVLPSNRVVGNDFVANGVSVEAGGGPLRIWTHGGAGNYWDGAVGRAGGVPDSYSPTDPVDGQSHRTPGALSLSASPAVTAVDAVRDTAPGMRDGDVLDTAPRAEPVRPGVVAALAGDRDG